MFESLEESFLKCHLFVQQLFWPVKGISKDMKSKDYFNSYVLFDSPENMKFSLLVKIRAELTLLFPFSNAMPRKIICTWTLSWSKNKDCIGTKYVGPLVNIVRHGNWPSDSEEQQHFILIPFVDGILRINVCSYTSTVC